MDIGAHRRTRWTVVAASAVAVLTLSAATTTSVAAAPRPGNERKAQQLVAYLLAGVRLPHDARRHDRAPARELRRPSSTTGSPNGIDRHAFITVPGSVQHALSYVRRHAASDCRFSGSGAVRGPHQRTEHEIFCTSRSTRFAWNPGVQVTAVQLAHRAALRIDAQTVWLPERPGYSMVRHPSRAHVVVQRKANEPGDHRLPTVRRTVGPAKSRELARVLDRQAEYPDVALPCPADFPGVQDTVHFRTARGPMTVRVELTGCPEVTVTVAHHRATYLQGAGAVDAAVRRVLHLSKRYAS